MAPSKRTTLLLLGLALLLVTAPTLSRADDDEVEDDDEDAAFLVVRKAMANEAPAFVGKPAVVTVEIFNAGESDARDIQVDDTADLPEGFSLAKGAAATKAFKKLEAGATASFSYSVVPGKGGRAYVLPRASVKYTVYEGNKDAARKASSSAPMLYVETPAEAAFRHVLTAGQYATLGVVRTPEQWRSLAIIGGFVGFVFGGSTVWGKAKAAGAAQRRSKALAALEKEK